MLLSLALLAVGASAHRGPHRGRPGRGPPSDDMMTSEPVGPMPMIPSSEGMGEIVPTFPMQQCGDIIQETCPMQDPMELWGCVSENKEMLTDQCMAAVSESPVWRCARDINAFCGWNDMENVIECLNDHFDNLSPECTEQAWWQDVDYDWTSGYWSQSDMSDNSVNHYPGFRPGHDDSDWYTSDGYYADWGWYDDYEEHHMGPFLLFFAIGMCFCCAKRRCRRAREARHRQRMTSLAAQTAPPTVVVASMATAPAAQYPVPVATIARPDSSVPMPPIPATPPPAYVTATVLPKAPVVASVSVPAQPSTAVPIGNPVYPSLPLAPAPYAYCPQ